MKQTKYEPGMKFNMLTLIRLTGKIKNNCKEWECKCDCGNITYITTSNIKTTKSCGCLRKKNKVDIKIGEKFGKLTVLEEIMERDEHRRIHYKCLCECGNITTPRASDLKNGNSTSCGKCSNFWEYNHYKDLTNQAFGKLTALKPILDKNDECYYNKSNRSMYWLCKCECGNVVKIAAQSILSGRTQSCGCGLGKESIGEYNIRQILENNNIPFRQEATFKDLKLNNALRFDFAILDENKQKILRLVEFDGEQHYKEVEFFGALKNIKNNDKIKNEYCINNNIPLVRIPYWERDNMTLEMLLGKEYLIG